MFVFGLYNEPLNVRFGILGVQLTIRCVKSSDTNALVLDGALYIAQPLNMGSFTH